MRAERAVEPTRSENITATWRRSAVSCGCWFRLSCAPKPHWKARGSREAFSTCLRRDPEVFKMLIGQVGKDGEINAVFGKTLRVLGHPEFLEPVGNLLHRGPRRI